MRFLFKGLFGETDIFVLLFVVGRFDRGLLVVLRDVWFGVVGVMWKMWIVWWEVRSGDVGLWIMCCDCMEIVLMLGQFYIGKHF